MKHPLLALSFALLASTAHALPTVDDVQAQVRQGHYTQAQSMMREVVEAKPGSARAHYLYAELLAHNAQFADASREAARARQLDPSLKFADAEKFRSFEQLLEREQARASRPPSTTTSPARNGASLDSLAPAVSTAAPSMQRAEAVGSTGLPGWVWPVGLVALAFVAWRVMRRGQGPAPSSMTPAAGYGAAPGYAPGYGPGTAPGYAPGGVAPMGGMGGGSGLMGVGLAAAGGVAAGMLAEKLLDRGHGNGNDGQRGNGPFERDSFANTPPATDPDAAALEDRSVDFGNGNDWDDGGSGSVDLGSGGGSDDGGW